MSKIEIQILKETFSVCKVADYSQVDLHNKFVFTGNTDEELSLVCPTEFVPQNTTHRDDGWRAFRIKGVLDFSLIGILSRISKVLADAGIGIFAISTYNTDYILIKSDYLEKAQQALTNNGDYEIQHL